ncbi:hypothetical protein VB780_28050 [Leptolyngbya sp. CCNP1308]|uniref:hypothetical protein n=1 Tax=Leptolyngbya sp. CCNP1308 TaxID=3110255 RepID=UPI002B206E88|nr:hypothetical protein [Leptolyngbya sp. CCNP1308]MEA5452459.1 hypothetical protein [Leptolyngbya sp. CCNP1308]
MTIPIAKVATVLLLVMGLASACDRPAPTATSSAPLDTPVAEGPPPPPEGAFLAQMSPTQTDQLTSLGIEVVVPGQVPPSFAIVEMRVDSSDTGPGYLVVYQNDRSQCFAVEFAAEGIGDPPATESRIPIQPPLFGDQGYGLNYGPFTEADLRAEFPNANLFTDWMVGTSGAYRLVGAAYIGDLFESLQSCEDVSPEEAVALVESFTVLTADPMADPLGNTP